MQPDSYWFTSPGGRPRNEDACGVLHFENGGLYVLADGLGARSTASRRPSA